MDKCEELIKIIAINVSVNKDIDTDSNRRIFHSGSLLMARQFVEMLESKEAWKSKLGTVVVFEITQDQFKRLQEAVR